MPLATELGSRIDSTFSYRRLLWNMKRVLFICSQNRMRSPTAEQIFASHPGVECTSAGTNHDADNPLTPELIEWAEIIFVMEETHRNKVTSKFRQYLANKRVICLDIPDEYACMDTKLIRLLNAKVPRFLTGSA